MTAPKFTPGPWTAKQNHWSRWEIHYGAGQLAGVAKPDDPASPPDTYAEAEANAHLIAAAPAMYEALESAARYLDPFHFPEAVRLVDAALAKARGEQP